MKKEMGMNQKQIDAAVKHHLGPKRRTRQPCRHDHSTVTWHTERNCMRRVTLCVVCLYQRTEVCDEPRPGSFVWRFTTGWHPHPALVKAVDNCTEAT